MITAFGLADAKHPKPKAVSPDKWGNDPAYVEIQLGPPAKIIYPNQEQWKRGNWPP